MTPAGSRSENFSRKDQTLQQSLSIAQDVFKQVGRGKINFVLIGLEVDVLFRDAENNFTADAVDKNLQTIDEYIKLCLDNDAKPVAMIFPLPPSIRENYRQKFFTPLIEILNEFTRLYDFNVANLFDLDIEEKYFAGGTPSNDNVIKLITASLTLKLIKLKIFAEEDFYRLSYDFFYTLAYTLQKEIFQAVMDKVFSATIEKLRHKQKIKLAFVTDHAATWCGDELYNLFAQNPRFDTTVFLCRGIESTVHETQRDLAQFQAAGINVAGIFDFETDTPPQDVVIFLRPYQSNFPKNFQAAALTPQTLWIYIHYCYETTTLDYYNVIAYVLSWKFFFDTDLTRKLFDENCDVGIPRGMVSGLPKMDYFFDEAAQKNFPWKLIRPDAKKIIWAPHWTLNNLDGTEKYSTFAYNFRFMYEFAKAHPETSWVVKPHPRLAISTVEAGLFPNVDAYENYLQMWNALPNAQVFTGAYYQPIFATSDGMILDSNSFIAEYQFTHKPLIYLTSDCATNFTELGKRLLNVSYLVDGKNFDDIAFAIQTIFIDGNDPIKVERQKIFDELLNYRQRNSLSASKFIYKTIVNELEVTP